MSSPEFSLPTSNDSTVTVSLLHGGSMSIDAKFIIHNPIHDATDIPLFSFLIENKKLGKKVLFDLGIMKAWKEKQPPQILKHVEAAKAIVDIEHDVADQLKAASISLESINSIVWSHHHIDHTGDPSLFPKSTSLVVGPGFKAEQTTFPGYPLNPDAVVCQDAFEGRELIELDFSSGLKIGGFDALDFFGDGSFYLLHAPGHTHDHLNALARTSENKFVFLGGDSIHHCGALRPSSYLPLPDSITPSPFESPSSHGVCPGSLFESIHPATINSSGDYKTTPFYELAPHMNVDLPEAIKTVSKMQVFDASPDVLVVFAHDESIMDVLPIFPGGNLTGWEKTNYKKVGTWRFLKDFKIVKAK